MNKNTMLPKVLFIVATYYSIVNLLIIYYIGLLPIRELMITPVLILMKLNVAAWIIMMVSVPIGLLLFKRSIFGEDTQQGEVNYGN